MSAIHRTSTWITFTRKVRPMLTATLPTQCIEPGPGCPGIVYPGDPWDVAHRRSHHLDPTQPLVPEAVGVAHRSCNRKAGAREGRAKQLRNQREDNRLPTADSGW